MEGECNGGTRVRGSRIQISGRIFNEFEEGVWWRRGRISESSRTEKVGVRRKDDGGVCSGV